MVLALVLVGASANVVITGIAKRNGHPISFWQFTATAWWWTATPTALRDHHAKNDVLRATATGDRRPPQ